LARVFDFRRYLEAKRTVDDRAMNRRIMGRLGDELDSIRHPSIVDVGAGTATGLLRLLDWGLVAPPLDYTAVDEDAASLETARQRLESVEGRSMFAASSLEAFAAEASHRGRFDLVLAHAFLDIVDLEPSVAKLVALARPRGLLYFPITFDGESIFEPADAEDKPLLADYHATIPGDGRAGRRLYHALTREPVDILEIGSSDWIVHPQQGCYPADEAFFLRSIIEMVHAAVGERATAWAARRTRQIAKGALFYVAHQIDCLARRRR